jgi:hypothetical protein
MCQSPRQRARQRAQSRSALASRRPTAVLVRRLSPPDSAPGQASWDVAGAYDLMDRQPGEDRTRLRGRYPRPPIPVQGAPPAPAVVPADMMPEAARERVTSSRAGTALAPSIGRHRLRSLKQRARLVCYIAKPRKMARRTCDQIKRAFFTLFGRGRAGAVYGVERKLEWLSRPSRRQPSCPRQRSTIRHSAADRRSYSYG